MFDLDKFMSSTASAPGSTQWEVCPEGDFPIMLDTDIKISNIKGESDKGPYDFWVMEIPCIIQDDAVKAKLGREKVTARMRINLDIDEATARLDESKGKNVQLNRLKEALGQNVAGWTPTMLRGAGPIMGHVRHVMNKKDPNSQPFAEIDRVAKIT